VIDMEAIRHRLGIEAPRAEVVDRLSTIDGLATWWTRDVEGDPSVGGTVTFRFGGPDRSVSMIVVESTDDRVVWECSAGPDEWVGSPFAFDLEQTGDETVLRFTQSWREPVDFMGHCSTKWGYFLLGLKASLEGGKGTPFPGELQISSWG
jgi:uncharacterized protein YndB with AHSA1/START domain